MRTIGSKEILAQRIQTVFSRGDFVPNDYAAVRRLAANSRFGRDPVGQASHALKKVHNLTTIPPDIEKFLGLIYLVPEPLRGTMSKALHETILLMKGGAQPQVILNFLDEIEKATEAKINQRTLSEQSAIDAVDTNSENIRREVIKEVAHKLFGPGSSK